MAAAGGSVMSVQTVSPRDVFGVARDGRRPRIIDVRTPAEYEQVHADGARLVPLDELGPAKLKEIAGDGSPDEPLYVICKSGARATRACEKFRAAGVSHVFCVDGGTAAWERAGLPVVRGTRKVIALERQVRIAAGLLVLVGVGLGWLVHPAFFAVSAFVGAGLVFAGVTDCCGMGMLLAKMPWNRASADGGCAGRS